MEYEVIMENSAERDLLDILTYISKTLLEPATAKRIYLSIKEQAQSLDHMPFRKNPIARWGCDGCRWKTIRPFT